MNWIAILFAVELGVMPMGNLHLFEPAVHTVESPVNYYADLGVRAVLWDMLYVGGTAKTYFADVKNTYIFNPESSNFLFEAGLQRGGFSLGFRHYCFHPFLPLVGDASIKRIWDGGYQEAFIRFEAKVGGKH